MLTPALTIDLQQFRAAAQQRDAEQCQYLLKKLLQLLSYYAALSIMLERLHGFLDIFESYYPDETWVRKLLIATVSFGTTPDDSVAELAMQQRFSAPGCGNYMKALYDVTQAMQPKHTGEARVGYMTSAIVNSIMAELAEAWYGEQEDLWERVRQNHYDPITQQFTDPEATQIAYDFWMDDSTAALDTACWLEVVVSIEKALQRM
jgi:hypothetical protein